MTKNNNLFIFKRFIFYLLLLFPAAVFCQNNTIYNCVSFDFETDTSNFSTIAIDNSINCLEINGALTALSLENIFLKINSIEKIEKIALVNYADKNLPSSLKQFKNLKCFSVKSSPNIHFRKFFSLLKNFKQLSVLELEDNEAADIPSTIKRLKSLNTLTIRDYEYVDANKLFKNTTFLPSLKHLTLSATGKTDLDKKTAFPKGLQSLDLSDNWLSILPEGMSKSKNLENLDLSENNFKDVRVILPIIAELPLKSFSISCYDIIDSLVFIKTLPDIDLLISIYRDFQKSDAHRNTVKKTPPPPFIDSFYSNTINPPISEPEIERTMYNIDSQKAQNIVYKTGSVIRIPENAFVDASNIPVKGEVSIFYREFNDLTDILANGISLNYDSAGKRYNFQTAGMFEIYASKGNQEVFLSPDKLISIDFSITDTSSGYNLYSLDETENNWTFKTPLNNDVRIVENNPNPAYRLYSNLLIRDLSYFDERYKDTAYARTSLIPMQYYRGKKKTEFSFFKLKRASKFIKNKDVKKLPTFYFDNLNYNTYKELSAYRNFLWVYSGNLNKKDFGKEYITRKKWTDVRIAYIPDDYIFEVELKSPHDFTRFRAFPVKNNYTLETKNHEKTYLKLDKRYNKTLTRVQNRFDKKMDKAAARQQKKVWDMIYNLMTPEEKAMKKEDWMDYARKQLAREKDSLNNTAFSLNNAFRVFQIDGFGIWNCDRIFEIKNSIEFIADFKDALDNKIMSSSVYVIDASNNTVVNYNDLNNNKLTLDSKAETAFFIQCLNGMVAVVDKENVKNTISSNISNSYTFTAYEINPSLLSTGELRRLLGF